ncbi:beta-crystallin B2-like [Ylistrum balloti]|uniref:beta-crystallin B2-like n=1 Tax=Ylistrum balloti TaxID=509963 RepID=UPI002905F13A|nr:beta-crystallin B2-like [Ylistrum balloti]
MSAEDAIGPHITLFNKPEFNGALMECRGPIYTLANTGMDKIGSVDVKRGVWILYEEVNFGGDICVIWEGQSLKDISGKKYSSLKAIEAHFSENPSMTIYSERAYGGKHITFTDEEANFVNIGYNDVVSSAKVEKGAWVGYEHINFEGRQYLFTRGFYDRSSTEGHFQDSKMSSLKPIRKVSC